MKFLKSIGLLFLFATLLFTSCRKDDESGGSIYTPGSNPTPEVIVNGSFSGTIVDESNVAIEDALITFGTNAVMSDKFGYFSFKNVDINEKGSLVTAEKDGYYYNAKFVGSKLNKQNFTKFVMIEKVLTGTFMANAGGTVSTTDGATIEFAANAIKQEGGGAYTGNVNVYSTWLDPTSPDLGQIMPGDLRATNANDVQQQLTTYGMIGVELEGDAGQALNIADGQTATIELPVPAELAANAPATIPLWHFDESTGYWVEDGEATLQGNKYVGTVSHFSFWNCDVPNDFIFIEGTITDDSGNPLQYMQVKITENSSGAVGFGWTDQDGTYAGAVPNDQELTLEVTDNCGVTIHSEAIGPFTADATIPGIAISTTENFLTVTGSLVNCDNEPVTNGYLVLDYENTTTLLSVDANGNFSQIVNICDVNTVETIGYDIDELKESTTTSHDVSSTTTLDLGALFVCDDLTEYLTYTIDDGTVVEEFLILNPTALNSTLPAFPGLQISGVSQDSIQGGYAALTMIIDTDEIGTYSPEYLDVSYEGSNNFYVYACQVAECNTMSIEITTIEAVGGFVIGTFTGTLPEAQAGPGQATIEGSFKAERE